MYVSLKILSVRFWKFAGTTLIISHLLYLIKAVVGKRTIQEDTYTFTMLFAHIYCRLNNNEFLVFNFLT